MGTSTEAQTSKPALTGNLEASASAKYRAWILAFSSIGVIWGWAAFVRGRGYGRALQLVVMAAIVAAIVLVLVLARKFLIRWRVLLSSEITGLLAFGSCAFILLAVFLPEYLLGKPQVFLRSFVLLGLCLLLFIAYIGKSTVEALTGRSRFSQRPGVVLTGFCVIYFVATTWMSLAKLHAFGYVGQDIAYFTQCLYTTLHGHLFYSNMYHDLLYGKAVSSDLAGHNQPVLLVFLLFYFVHKSATTLLVVRNVFVVICAWPVYLISRRFLSPAAAAVAAISFLVLPAVVYQNLYDFAPLSLAAFPLLFSLYWFLENRFLPYAIALICTQMVREDLVFAVFGLGLLALWQRRPLKWCLFPCGFAVFWAFLTWKIVFPYFLHGSSSAVGTCFSYLGSNPRQMLRYVIAHPGIFLSRSAFIYMKQIVDSFGGILFLFNPLFLFSIPYVAINLLGDAGGCDTAMIYRHYALVPVVLLFGSYLMSLENITARRLTKRPGTRGSLPGAVALFVLFAALSSTVLVTGKTQFDELRAEPWHEEARRVAAMIPANASVAVPRYMLPSVSNREELYQSLRLLEYHHPEPAYIVIDKNWHRMNATEQWRENYDTLRQLLEASNQYRVMYDSANYAVYKLCDGCVPNLPHREPMRELHD